MANNKTDPAPPNAASAAAAPPPTTDGATPAPTLPAPSSAVHCPYRRTVDLLQRLAPNKMRVAFFIGAGCSLSVQGADGKPLIPEIVGLTKQVKDALDNDAKIKTVAQTAWDRVVSRGMATPTVEDVLSHIRTLKSLCGDDSKGQIDGFTSQQLSDLDLAICEQVRKIVDKPLPTIDTPYHVLASWIQAIPRERLTCSPETPS